MLSLCVLTKAFLLSWGISKKLNLIDLAVCKVSQSLDCPWLAEAKGCFRSALWLTPPPTHTRTHGEQALAFIGYRLLVSASL